MSFFVCAGRLYEFNPISKTLTSRYDLDVKQTKQFLAGQTKPIPPIFGVARWGDKIVLSASILGEDKIIVLNSSFQPLSSFPILRQGNVDPRQRQLHQVRVFGDKAIVADTGFDALIVLDLLTGEMQSKSLTEDGVPTQHVNSMEKFGDQLYVMCHRHGPSVVKVLDYATLEQIDQFNLGVKAHNLWMMGGKIWTCSSGEGTLVSQDGESIAVGAFPRGVFQTESMLYVGLSGRYRRVDGTFVTFEYKHPAKIVYVNTSSRQIVDEFELPSKMISDMA